jgi:hypothetical protein
MGSVVYNCCWPSPAQSFSGLSPAEIMTTFYYLKFETSPIWRARSPYIYPPETGWPTYTARHWVSFSSPPTTRRAAVGVITAVIMKNYIFRDITHLAWYLLSRWFLAWLNLWPWRWRRHVPPKRQLTFHGLHGVISRKIELFRIVDVPAEIRTRQIREYKSEKLTTRASLVSITPE